MVQLQKLKMPADNVESHRFANGLRLAFDLLNFSIQEVPKVDVRGIVLHSNSPSQAQGLVLFVACLLEKLVCNHLQGTHKCAHERCDICDVRCSDALKDWSRWFCGWGRYWDVKKKKKMMMPALLAKLG